MKRLALAIVALSGCEDPCVDGVCPRFDLSTHYAGPCESAVERVAENGQSYGRHCTYDYDGTRIANIECRLWNEFGDIPSQETTTWVYDADGQPVRIESELISEGTHALSSRWQLDTDPITYSEGRTTPSEERLAYDRATFAFLPIVGTGVRTPRAELGLLRAGEATFTWNGSSTSLTRTSSTGRLTTFELDARGRIVHSNDRQPSGGRIEDETWTFDGDLLRESATTVITDSGTSHYATEYIYDLAGNIAKSGDEAYAYNCW
jgi:YD repeat-containing protein